jgi:hypothetical protein
VFSSTIPADAFTSLSTLETTLFQVSRQVTILEEAVGYGDEIYVVTEINGIPFLTKGACFSYYEFQNESRLTDEEWQTMLDSPNVPDRPIWTKELYINANSLESSLIIAPLLRLNNL